MLTLDLQIIALIIANVEFVAFTLKYKYLNVIRI